MTLQESDPVTHSGGGRGGGLPAKPKLGQGIGGLVVGGHGAGAEAGAGR